MPALSLSNGIYLWWKSALCLTVTQMCSSLLHIYDCTIQMISLFSVPWICSQFYMATTLFLRLNFFLNSWLILRKLFYPAMWHQLSVFVSVSSGDGHLYIFLNSKHPPHYTEKCCLMNNLLSSHVEPMICDSISISWVPSVHLSKPPRYPLFVLKTLLWWRPCYSALRNQWLIGWRFLSLLI